MKCNVAHELAILGSHANGHLTEFHSGDIIIVCISYRVLLLF